MIKHEYKVPSDNVAQWSADQIDRQEVTHEFMLNEAYGVIDYCYFWGGDECVEFGLDPWRTVDDFEYFAKPDTRVFVSRKDLVRVSVWPKGYPGDDGIKSFVTAKSCDDVYIKQAKSKYGSWAKLYDVSSLAKRETVSREAARHYSKHDNT